MDMQPVGPVVYLCRQQRPRAVEGVRCCTPLTPVASMNGKWFQCRRCGWRGVIVL